MTSMTWGAYAHPGSGFPSTSPPTGQDRARSAMFRRREEQRRERAAVAAEIRARQAVSRARERVELRRRALAEPRGDVGRGLCKLREARDDLEQAERQLASVARPRSTPPASATAPARRSATPVSSPNDRLDTAPMRAWRKRHGVSRERHAGLLRLLPAGPGSAR